MLLTKNKKGVQYARKTLYAEYGAFLPFRFDPIRYSVGQMLLGTTPIYTHWMDVLQVTLDDRTGPE